MKKSIIIVAGSIITLLIIGTASFYLRRVPGMTRVELAGVTGARFTGYYVRDGKRVAISSVLPWSFQSRGISEFEFRKVRPEELLTFTTHYDEPGGTHAVHVISVPPGVLGFRDRFHDHGMDTEKLEP